MNDSMCLGFRFPCPLLWDETKDGLRPLPWRAAAACEDQAGSSLTLAGTATLDYLAPRPRPPAVAVAHLHAPTSSRPIHGPLCDAFSLEVLGAPATRTHQPFPHSA